MRRCSPDARGESAGFPIGGRESALGGGLHSPPGLESGDRALREEGVDCPLFEAEAVEDLAGMLAEAGGMPRDPGR